MTSKQKRWIRNSEMRITTRTWDNCEIAIVQCDEYLSGYVGAFGDVTPQPMSGGGAWAVLIT